jgi:hypothetical protein
MALSKNTLFKTYRVIQASPFIANESLGVRRLACVEGINTVYRFQLSTGSKCYYKAAMNTVFYSPCHEPG